MPITRFLFGLLALLVTASSLAASVADRSPFAQGVWWNPARSGDGFQIFNAGDQAALLWYTYDDAGKPIWYIAQGDLATLGTQSWPLLKHRWANGRKAEPTQVGTVRLSVRHPEGMDLAWEIGGKQGAWAIQPFTVSGVITEVDHSGLWFDPANSGWGFSLTEQGDIMGGLLFTYDASGAPTWVAGFDRTPNTVELHAFTGSCTACAYQPPQSRSVGRLSFDFQSETRLTLFNETTLPMAQGVNIGGARLVSLSRSASSRAADRQLAHFDSAPALKAYLDAGMMQMPASSGGVDFSSAPPAAVFSPTNLQESGVDEADLVKSNGRYVYTYAHGDYGQRLPAVRSAKIGDDGGTLEARESVWLKSGPDTRVDNAGLYLAGDDLIAVAGARVYSYGPSPWSAVGDWVGGVTTVEVMTTAANPDRPSTRWRATIDGYLLSSRRIGQRLYVITRFVPYVPGFVRGSSYPATVTANRQLLADTPLAALLPKVRIHNFDVNPLVEPSQVYAPPQGARNPLADMITVTAIDLGEPRIAQSLAIIGSVETVYASSANLFVASSRYNVRSGAGVMLPVQPPFVLTDIHQIRLGAEAMSVVASGSIEGVLGYDVDKAAFRLSEHQGRLRAVTSSSNSMWGGPQRNRLTILEPSALAPGLLKTVSYLPNARRPQTLGKPNEILYATRFVGDRLYAVTFKSIDPLYVVDLADSTDPRIAGALELPGFSEYLHPLPNGLLLGFGKDARPAGVSGDGNFAWYQGLQLSLFDVSDAARPREIQRVLMGKRGSDSALLRSHHAMSALPNSDGSLSIAFPARIHDGVPDYYSGDSTWYPWQYTGLMRFEVRGTGPSDARLVQAVAPLVVHSRSSLAFPNESVNIEARSVLLRNGAVYIAGGRFWHQDNMGNTTGPY